MAGQGQTGRGLFSPGREPNSRSGAVTTVTLAIQVAVSVRQLLERVPRPAHQGRWRGPACAAQLLSDRRDALDMPRHVREEDARGSLSRWARWSSPAASAKSLTWPGSTSAPSPSDPAGGAQIRSAPCPGRKRRSPSRTVPCSPSQAGGCRNPNRLPNGSSIWHSRSPVMIVFGPRCALAPCWLHSATVASTSETVQYGTVPDGPG